MSWALTDFNFNSSKFISVPKVSEIFQGEGVKLLTQIHELATMLEQEGQLSSRPDVRYCTAMRGGESGGDVAHILYYL